MLRPIARWCQVTLGATELQRLCEEADVMPQWFEETSRWVSLQQFEAVLSAGRARVASDKEFMAISVFEYDETYRRLRLMNWATTPAASFRAAALLGGYFSTAGRFTLLEVTRNRARLRWTSRCRESRLMCLSRQAGGMQSPTVWGMPAAHVREHTCIARGDDCCEYEYYWLNPQRWLPALLGAVLGSVVAYIANPPRLVESVLPFVGAVFGYIYEHRRVERGNSGVQSEVADSVRDLLADAAEASRKASIFEERLRAAEKRAARVDTFIGREREMATLGVALQDAAARRGRLILISGEAGIGKTRLAEEFVATAQSGGARVLVGRCHEDEGAPALWPWVQILRSALRDETPARFAADLGLGLAEIAQLVRELSQPVSADNAPLVLEPSHARFRLFDRVASLLQHLSTSAVLVIVLDDLQWADRPTLFLLQFLVSQIHDVHLLVVGAYRDRDLGPGDALTQALPDLMREPGCEAVALGGLAREQLAPFIARITGAQARDALVAAVYDITEGNPFFTREVVRLLASEGSLETVGVPGAPRIGLPHSVREVVQRRLGRLSADCNRVLEVGAVIGREFVLHRTAPVTALGRSRLLEVMEEALAARVIRPGPTGENAYSFAHAVVHEVLYDSIPASRRAEVHGQIAEALEQGLGGDTETTLAELAHHYSEAARAGVSVDKAAAYLRRAGDVAMRLAAYEDAVRSYARALDLLRTHQSPNEQVQCELLLALGEAQMHAGDASGARERSFQAADLARRLSLHDHFARAALGFGWWFRIDVVDEERIALLTEALGQAGDHDSAVKSKLTARLAAALYWIPDTYERREQMSAEAVAMARRVEDADALTFALNARLYALWTAGNAELRLPVSRELLQLAEAAQDLELALQSRQWIVADLMELGEVDAAYREIALHARQAEALREPVYLWFAAVWRAMRALLEGRFAEAEPLAEEALALGLRAEPENAEATYAAQIFLLRREQGRLDEFVAIMSAQANTRPTLAAAYGCGLAMTFAELGRELDARLEFERLAASGIASALRANPLNWQTAAAAAVEACSFINDPRAADLYNLLLPFAQRNIVAGMALALFGSGARYLGLLATTLRRWPEAERHFRDALAMHERLRARPLLARTQHDYARMLVARDAPGDRAQALDLLGDAVGWAGELGMRSLLDKAVALQATINADHPPRAPSSEPAPPTPAGAAAGNPLFRQEGEYWSLEWEGMVSRLRNSKGLHYIAHLLRHPRREFHARELLALVADGRPPHVESSDTAPVLDAKAKADYKRRLDELRAELEEAQHFNDSGRVTRAQREIDAIGTQLTAAVGLSGRDRLVTSDAERARLAVTKRIKAALQKIRQANPALAQHLTASISTGSFCSYQPRADTVRPWLA